MEVSLRQAGLLGSRTSFPMFACEVLEIRLPFAPGRSLGEIPRCPTSEDASFRYPKVDSPMVLYGLYCCAVYTVVQAWSFCSCPGTHLLERDSRGGQTESTVGGWKLAPFLQLIYLAAGEHRSCPLWGPSSPAFSF